MLRSGYRRLRVWRSARRLGSRAWADYLTDRHPAHEFRSFSESSDLYFKLLDTRLRRRHAHILLGQYSCARDLVIRSGVRFECMGFDLVAKLPGLKLRLQTSEEVFILHETVVTGIYNCEIQGPTLVVDVGSNVAFTALYLAQNPLVRVVGYEPFKANWLAADHNLRLNPAIASRVTIHQLALGSADGVRSWPYSEKRGGSSGAFEIPNAPSGTYTVDVRVANAATQVARAIEQAGADRLICKIDCEGSEFEIIECLADNDLLSAFSAFMVEWHRRAGRDPKELVDRFVAHGFTVFRTGSEADETGMLYAARAR